MGKYVADNVGTGEAVRYVARVSLWKFSSYLLVGGLLISVLFPVLIMTFVRSSKDPASSSSAVIYIVGLLLLFAVFIFIWPFIARNSTELVITDKRLISKYGVISTQSIEIRFEKIESVRVMQGLVGRILNYGDIVVTGTGSTLILSVTSSIQWRFGLL